ncbi:MAG: class I SAM-dependent methyltransferase [Alphaproteobacteria bacterium]|nr:class I SAM-dependent methyltransferase [Alphaproteobacteria bacterium]
MSSASKLADVATYYTEKLTAHGQTARGVDWNGEESQNLRFTQLCKIIDPELKDFSINDLGCGYAALVDFLVQRHPHFSYNGFDVSQAMLDAAMERHKGKPTIRFGLADKPDAVADYGIASGIFNVRLKQTDAEWLQHFEATLDELNRTSRRGFAFNALTSYSDADKMRENLYYASPATIFDICKKRYSRNVALLHDYDLYEFTILVRKA